MSQGSNAISIGSAAGENVQGSGAIAIGYVAGLSAQGIGAIAIGDTAGRFSQGSGAIAIGMFAGQTNQPANSIVINASSAVNLNGIANGCIISPLNTTNAGSDPVIVYNTTSKELIVNTTKTFVIDHPQYSTDKYLVHACLEGPEAGVYYRGKGKIPENKNSVIVELPNYCKKWNDFTIQTNTIVQNNNDCKKYKIYGTSDVIIDNENEDDVISNNNNIYFIVYGKENTEFYWTTFAKRLNIDVEIDKSSVKIDGFGPYRYISSIE